MGVVYEASRCRWAGASPEILPFAAALDGGS